MSIQRRLAISTTLVLLFSLAIGFALTYAHVISKVRTELQAALAVGGYSALNTIDNMNETADPEEKLRRLVREFDGDRHLQATFAAPGGAGLVKSRLLPADDPAPSWFRRLVSSPLPENVLSLPTPFRQVGSLTLRADPSNEVAEAWSDTRLTLTIMALFFTMVLTLAFVTIRAALAPLRDVCVALERVGSGDYKARIEPDIAQELAPLQHGFNGMAERLEEMSLQNRVLNEQIMTLQEEERAELARDLHDEVAPFLFSVGADVAMIRQFLTTGSAGEIAPRATAIADAVKHMQRHLKVVLQRLAPGALLDLGLSGAIENVTSFWKTRQPPVAFRVVVTGEPIDPPLDAVAFRIVQESISNAIRHGRPSEIDVTIDADETAATIMVEDDGIGFPATGPKPGFGLTGMAERVRSAQGTLSIRNRGDRRGAVVEAHLPIVAKSQTDDVRKVDVPA